VRALAVSAAAIVAVVALTNPGTGGRTALATTGDADAAAARGVSATTEPQRGVAERAAADPVAWPDVVAVVGDGIATTFAPGARAVAAVHGTEVVVNAFPGCGIANGVAVDDHGAPYPWAALCAQAVGPAQWRMVRAHDPGVVVWLSTWDLSDRLAADGRVLLAGTPVHDAALEADLVAAARRLTSGGARLVLVVPAPRAGLDVDAAERDGPTPIAHHSRLLRRFAAAHPALRITVVDAADVLCPNGPPCPEWIAGIRPRPDGGHFSLRGATWTAERLFPIVLATLGGL
jgi:hypothetical protein